jgi:hypothetical protein
MLCPGSQKKEKFITTLPKIEIEKSADFLIKYAIA